MESECQRVCLCDSNRFETHIKIIPYIFLFHLDSPYRDDINEAILLLKENRIVQDLKTKWWIEKNFLIVDGEPVNCAKENEKSSLDEPDLDIEHILGVVLVLITGIGLAFFIGISEFLWNVRKVSIAQKVRWIVVTRHIKLISNIT